MRMMMDGFIEVLVLGGIGPGQQTLTCQLPHIWGIFTHFWPDKWVYHSFTHCHTLLCNMQICHSLLFWRNATHFNDFFCHTFSLLQIEGLWNLGSPRILGFPNHTFWKKFGWQVFKHSSTTMTILKHSNMNAQKESHLLLHLLGAGGACIALACTFSPLTFGNWSSPQLDSYISNIATY